MLIMYHLSKIILSNFCFLKNEYSFITLKLECVNDYFLQIQNNFIYFLV